MGKKFYSYYIPETEEIGIVDNWKDCFNKVSGTKAKYKSFLTYQEAKMWLNYMISPDTAPLPTPLFSSKKNQKFYGSLLCGNNKFCRCNGVSPTCKAL